LAPLSIRDFSIEARTAGYQVVAAEQLRANRLLMTLSEPSGCETLVMVQARAMIGASDVQDFAEIMQLRHPARGIILAHGGVFSPAAQQTLVELGDVRVRLCTTLPPVAQIEGDKVAGLAVNRASL
jgi:hypothetical protein